MIDPIADLIIEIKNAGNAGKDVFVTPFSKVRFAIAELLVKEGFLKAATKKGKKVTKFIEIALVYEGGKPKVTDVERVSKLSRRVYQKASEIRKVRNGYGLAVLTTPKGIMTGEQAKAANVGGEVLFNIW